MKPSRFSAKSMIYSILSVTVALFFTARFAAAAAPDAQPGATRIAKWKDDRKAVFLIMFDDSCPSHWQIAIPALVARNLVATFYINPGKAEYSKFKGKWENEIWKTGMVYGDHTMTHQGVKDLENADWEIGACAKVITDIGPGKKPRLISWGMPGVGPGKWNISGEQLKSLLAKYHLVSRPTFDGHGAVYHWQKTEQMLALADKGIKAGDMEYLVIHGVERGPDMNWGYQDFWALKQTILFGVLDGLKERRDRGDLWITDHISYHQYLTERTSAKVRTLPAGPGVIKRELTSAADPNFYDLPLTLVTQVPAGWRQCRIVQGTRTATAVPVNGAVQFEALPNGGPITLEPSSAAAPAGKG